MVNIEKINTLYFYLYKSMDVKYIKDVKNCKICSKCKIEKPISEFNKNSNTKDKLH